MIFEYDIVTGWILNGVCSREIKKGSDNMYDSKPQNYFTDDDGMPLKIPANHRIEFHRDSEISMQYLHFIRDSNNKPVFKYILKNNKPVKIVPISGVLPVGFRAHGLKRT